MIAGFKTLLDEVGNPYPGLLLHSNVHWLSKGKAQPFCRLSEQNQEFSCNEKC